MIEVMTHRGLDPSKENYYAESSAEAFRDQLQRGYGLEFDLRLSKDGVLVVSHDSNFSRISQGKVISEIGELTWAEIERLNFGGCHIANFDGLLKMIDEINNGRISAIHLKYQSQNEIVMDQLVAKMTNNLEDQFIIFDLKPESAAYLKGKNAKLHLAASVSHPFDIERYNSCVGGTLFSVEEVIKHRALFDWVWLDEWDRSDVGGEKKSLYNHHVFNDLRKYGFKIALVSPELHGTSPGLLGAEAHPDASNPEILRLRMQQIAELDPDVVCTDYPDLFLGLARKKGVA